MDSHYRKTLRCLSVGSILSLVACTGPTPVDGSSADEVKGSSASFAGVAGTFTTTINMPPPDQIATLYTAPGQFVVEYGTSCDAGSCTHVHREGDLTVDNRTLKLHFTVDQTLDSSGVLVEDRSDAPAADFYASYTARSGTTWDCGGRIDLDRPDSSCQKVETTVVDVKLTPSGPNGSATGQTEDLARGLYQGNAFLQPFPGSPNDYLILDIGGGAG
jgi:hypothetical protein